MDPSTWLILFLMVVAGFLFYQNMMLQRRLPEESKENASKTRSRRVRDRSRDRALEARERVTTVIRESDIDWLPVLATVLILAILGLFVFQNNAMRQELAELRGVIAAQTDNEAKMAELEAEVERLAAEAEQEGEADPAFAEQFSSLSQQLSELEARLESLKSDNDETATTTAFDPEDTSGADPPTTAAAIDAYMASMGWTPGSYRTEGITWNKPDAGQYSFTAGQIRSRASLAEAFETVPGMKEAVLAADSDIDAAELLRIYSAQHHYPVQITQPGVIRGNTYLVNGVPIFTDKDRPVSSGDVTWVYVGADGHVLPAGNVRADCGNPGVTVLEPEPPPPAKPPAPPTPPPPTEEPPPPGEEPPPPVQEPPPPGEEPVPPQRPEPEPPKCFDADGNPVFEGEFCADPDSGAEQQPVQDNDPDLVAPTPGYVPGNAEEIVGEQEEAADCIAVGDCDPHDPTDHGVEAPDGAPGGAHDEPPPDTPDNPDHDTPPTENPDDGTDDSEETEVSDDDPPPPGSDPGMP